MNLLSSPYEKIRPILNRKLGACPKCMASSIVGTVLSWIMEGSVYALWPNRIALLLGLTVAGFFTVLMTAHVVVHMWRVARLRRQLGNRTGRQEAPEVRAVAESGNSRREFTLSVARSGFAFAAAAVMTLPLLQKRAEAAPGWCLYQVTNVTAGCGSIQNSVICMRCNGSCPSYATCSHGGCEILSMYLISTGACEPCDNGIVLKGNWSCS